MPNQSMLPQRSDTRSHLRCPRSSCPDYHRHLIMDIGQDESLGHLTVRHWCPSCTYAELGPSTPRAARRTSSTLAALLLRQRLGGVEVPLVYDDSPWPDEEWADG